MSNYTKSTNFATKDNLPTGDPLKIVKGTEIDTEYNNIATAIATKTDNASAAITGGTIVGITDLAIADGGTGASTATAALNNLLPSQTSAANKYLQSDGTNASWDAVTLSTSDITGTLPVANGGTGVTSSTGTGSVVLSNSPTLVTPALGTPASGTATNLTGLPISTGVSGLGTGVATALSVNTGSTGAPVLFNGALGTPSSGNVSNLTGTASININGTVGAVGPASGSFTTLTSSSTVTINGGTANGIGYLNGSKVFTTGTVLKFDGTNITSDRSVGTVYSGTSFATWTNGIVLNNSATPATGLLNSLYFTNNANMQNVFGVVQNSSGYGDFVWAGYSGTYTEWMKLTSSGLTLTSNPTLSGGTANGVTYLNGSKVLTSGSALTFNGTDTFAYGGSNSGAYNGFAVNNTSSTGYSRINLGIGVSSATGLGVIKYAPSLFFAIGTESDSSSTPITFLLNNSEAMRLTSTLLYTASAVNIAIGASSATSGTRLTIQESATNSAALSLINRNSTQNWKITVDGVSVDDKLLAFIDNGTSQIRMALTDTGNLGLGVTPSAWNAAGYKAIEFGSLGTALYGAANDVYLTANTYFNSSWKYANNNGAGQYQIAGNVHRWFNAASGTAGNAITFTTAMTLNAAGRLSIGTTVADTQLTVHSTAATSTTPFANSLLQIRANGSSADGTIQFTDTALYNSYIGAGGGSLYFATNGTTERARFNATGALVFAGGTTTADGIGITFPATQSASTNANTLDDYEEGTWTPTIIGTTTAGTGTYTTQTGSYTKIGNQVTLHLTLTWTAHTGTGNMRISGLPFTVGSYLSAGSVGLCDAISLTASNSLAVYSLTAEARLALVQNPTGGGTAAGVPMDTSAGPLVISITYTV